MSLGFEALFSSKAIARLPTGSAPPEPPYVEPGRESWIGVNVAGAGIVNATEMVVVGVIVTVDLIRRRSAEV